MKSLKINSDSCLLNKNTYDISINGTDIGKLVHRNLPEGLTEYRDYPVKMKIEIEFLGEDDLNITTEGYEIKKEESRVEE